MPTKKLTKRWLYNNFLVILIFLSALIIAFSLAIRNYYYNSVLSVVKNTAAVQNASLINYSEDNTVDFSVAARKMVEDFEDKDLMELHRLESTLVYFATSLRANNTVMDRLTRYKRLEQYPDDRELLDDVIVELRQAIEMTSIYRDDIKGTRELFSSILDNRLNNAMKYLTSVTLIMAVPTVISGLYGMNVNAESMPFVSSGNAFGIVCGIILLVCAGAAWALHRNHML